jgi:hypothetical protein
MTSREPSNPVVHRLAAAINDGDRDTFLATLTPDTGSPPGNRTAWPGQADGRHLAGGLSRTGVTR